MKTKNLKLAVENEKLRNELSQPRPENTARNKKATLDMGVQVQINVEEKKTPELDFKLRNKGRDKSPEPNKPQRVLHPQLEIDFKEITLEKQISEGGYGLIYRGRWRESVVAVKMLKIDMKEEHVRDFICKKILEFFNQNR